MKRAKLGDVFAFKAERGYRIIQWAYHIPKKGRFLKIFPGFYDEKPSNLIEILNGDCLYIVNFYLPFLLSKNILDFWGNYQECILEPFPKLMIEFRKYVGDQILYRISNSLIAQDSETYIGNSSGDGIPKKYNHVRLLNLNPCPMSFLHMLSSDFDLKHFDYFWPTDEEKNRLKENFHSIV